MSVAEGVRYISFLTCVHAGEFWRFGVRKPTEKTKFSPHTWKPAYMLIVGVHDYSSLRSTLSKQHVIVGQPQLSPLGYCTGFRYFVSTTKEEEKNRHRHSLGCQKTNNNFVQTRLLESSIRRYIYTRMNDDRR